MVEQSPGGKVVVAGGHNGCHHRSAACPHGTGHAHAVTTTASDQGHEGPALCLVAHSFRRHLSHHILESPGSTLCMTYSHPATVHTQRRSARTEKPATSHAAYQHDSLGSMQHPSCRRPIHAHAIVSHWTMDAPGQRPALSQVRDCKGSLTNTSTGCLQCVHMLLRPHQTVWSSRQTACRAAAWNAWARLLAASDAGTAKADTPLQMCASGKHAIERSNSSAQHSS